MATLEAFYCPDLASLNINSTVVLSESEQKHLKVKRYHYDDEVMLTDGKGLLAKGVSLGEDVRFAVHITEIMPQQPLSPIRCVLFLALLKGKAFDEAVKMAVELGVDVIVPWQADRSIAKWHDEEKELLSLQRLVIESAKQSRRAHFPIVSHKVNSKNITNTVRAAAEKEIAVDRFFLLYEHASEPLYTPLSAYCEGWLQNSPLPTGGVSRETYVAFVVGPEGGITDNEVNLFVSLGAKAVSLGQNILRAPTAVASTLAVFSQSSNFSF